MLVLIDESGCPSLKINKGATPYFVVAMVIFNDFSAAEEASSAIGMLREKLGVKPEFKFSKSCDKVRDEFFKLVKKYEFLVRALVADKRNIYSNYLRQNKESFYNFFVRNLMEHDENRLSNATIKIDGSGSKAFQRAMRSYLSSQIGCGKIQKIKMINSKSDNLIQLADMVVGAIARTRSGNRKDKNRWFKMLEGKIDNIWNFR